MGACPTIHTERLVLRPFQSDDVDPYLDVLRTPEVTAALHLDEVSRLDAWRALVSFLGEWEMQNTGQWAVEEEETGRFVGRAGSYLPARDDWPGIEIGWTLHPDRWGRGYATEAGGAAVTHTFASHDTDELFSVILPENTRSSSVAQKLGFSLFETRIVSHFPQAPHDIWRLSRAEWEG